MPDRPGCQIMRPFCLDQMRKGVTWMPRSSRRTRDEVLRRLRGHVHSEGRVVIGFGAGRGYEFSEFLTDAHQAGLEAVTTACLAQELVSRQVGQRNQHLCARTFSRPLPRTNPLAVPGQLLEEPTNRA
jgi:hypothetical protein